MSAADDISTIVDWLNRTSRFRRTPLGDDRVLIGPYACVLAVDPDSTDWPDLSELAEGGLALFVPTQQLATPHPLSRLSMPPHGHPARAVFRVDHMFGHKLGVELPDVLSIALNDPGQSINDALAVEGLADLDLDAAAMLAIPLWAMLANDRAEIERLCRYP